MRVLLAIDGSTSSEAACELVCSFAWPSGSVIKVIAALEPFANGFGTPIVPAPVENDRETARQLNVTLSNAAGRLVGPGRAVERALIQGRAATVITNEAAAFRAELVVVGSRGLGPMTSMVLGSVSAEVVDHAPCPVLVVRRATVGSVLLAVDGSASAEAAVTFVLASKFLADRPIEVLSVAPAQASPPPILVTGLLPDSDADQDGRTVSPYREHAEAFAAAAVQQLRGDGFSARWSISQGSAATEIIEAADDFGADLVVMGSRGHTGLTRVVLGSVARNVLLHTAASVLIVREALRNRLPERHKMADLVAVGRASRPSPTALG